MTEEINQKIKGRSSSFRCPPVHAGASKSVCEAIAVISKQGPASVYQPASTTAVAAAGKQRACTCTREVRTERRRRWYARIIFPSFLLLLSHCFPLTHTSAASAADVADAFRRSVHRNQEGGLGREIIVQIRLASSRKREEREKAQAATTAAAQEGAATAAAAAAAGIVRGFMVRMKASSRVANQGNQLASLLSSLRPLLSSDLIKQSCSHTRMLAHCEQSHST